MLGANRNVALGLINFDYQLTNPHFYMKIINSGIALNGFWVNISCNSGAYFLSGPKINYLTVDAAFTHPFSISYFTSVHFFLSRLLVQHMLGLLILHSILTLQLLQVLY